MSDDLTRLPVSYEAERICVGSVMHDPRLAPTILDAVAPGEWNPNLLDIVLALRRLHERAAPMDPQAVVVELAKNDALTRAGGHVGVFELFQLGFPAQAEYYLRLVTETVMRRRFWQSAVRAQQVAEKEQPTERLQEQAIAMIGALELLLDATSSRSPELSPDVYALLASKVDVEWTIPGLLAVADRMLITAPPGWGKSELIRMICVCAAAGIHPFSWGETFEPCNVMLVDAENSRGHVSRKMRPLVEHAAKLNRPVGEGKLRVEVRQYLDLASADDADWLLTRCAVNQPDILAIGPVYKLHAPGDNWAVSAHGVLRALDRVRERHGCAIIMEAHYSHPMSGRRPDPRPSGSWHWSAWPEFGFGLMPHPVDEKDHAELVAWRGSREDDRFWPQVLKRGTRGQSWPWVVDEDPRFAL